MKEIRVIGSNQESWARVRDPILTPPPSINHPDSPVTLSSQSVPNGPGPDNQVFRFTAPPAKPITAS